MLLSTDVALIPVHFVRSDGMDVEKCIGAARGVIDACIKSPARVCVVCRQVEGPTKKHAAVS